MLNAGHAGWAEILTAAVLLAGVLVLGRHYQTPGERLFDTHYWHHLAPEQQTDEAAS